MDNKQSFNELALFAGAGGGILGGKLLGWRTVCAVECEKYPASILCARQNEGILPPFPIWDDVQTFDGKPWRGIVDVVSGGFPCQDISPAGKGTGISGAKSKLWHHMSRIICEVRPSFVFVENSSALTRRGLWVVLGNLAEMGYDVQWGVLSAAAVGANHKRERIWIVGKISNTNLSQCNRERIPIGIQKEQYDIGSESWWQTEPDVGRVANGLAARVDRLKATGNGQVPLCAATAWTMLNERFKT